jgi:hypothetical protein
VLAGAEGFTTLPARPYERVAAGAMPGQMVGRSQAVRQRILIPPCGGSNPPAPANTAPLVEPDRRSAHPSPVIAI